MREAHCKRCHKLLFKFDIGQGFVSIKCPHSVRVDSFEGSKSMKCGAMNNITFQAVPIKAVRMEN